MRLEYKRPNKNPRFYYANKQSLFLIFFNLKTLFLADSPNEHRHEPGSSSRCRCRQGRVSRPLAVLGRSTPGRCLRCPGLHPRHRRRQGGRASQVVHDRQHRGERGTVILFCVSNARFFNSACCMVKFNREFQNCENCFLSNKVIISKKF